MPTIASWWPGVRLARVDERGLLRRFGRADGGPGRLHPEIGSVRDRSRTTDVITDLWARQVRGKAVLTVR
ncbi:hypothetical protein [Streptomyces sp. NPDC059970]|uniref:hypothetical protein n=1 Tax=Streptomyces sp. NPDC059970 TaxID=3347019 RepID=UPI0036C34FAC